MLTSILYNPENKLRRFYYISLSRRFFPFCSRHSDGYRFYFDIPLQSLLSQFTSNSRLFETTEWGLVDDHVVCVDPEQTKNRLSS